MQMTGPGRRGTLSRSPVAGLGLWLLSCLMAPTAFAQDGEARLGLSLAHYERTLQNQDEAIVNVLSWYFDGVLNGVAWSFADHRARNQPLPFCLPDKLKLTVQEMQATIAVELEARGEFWRRTPDVPIARVLGPGLKRRCPCPS